ncbi:hypothetical protein EsDP_00007098 [Epichloe bromicola]|uniref:Glutamyl-tRNA synthetase n=1 Tax=Epichloe bromicola TaxID=79588 RepID=A0ABQ0CZL3_9HYPO
MAAPSLTSLSPAHEQALRLIDEAHAEDPNKTDEPDGSDSVPGFANSADSLPGSALPPLTGYWIIFRRWELPRSSFPMTRPGYLSWRAKQKSQAASKVAELLTASTIQPPFSDGERDRVAALIRKEGLSTDNETKVLEDVACLVFLDDQFDDFEAKDDIDEEKMVAILRKTWGKMTEEGRQLALGMDLSDRAKTLIGKALGGYSDRQV